MTRKETALRLLRDCGGYGACAYQLVNAGVGYRFSARIHELRREGHKIRTGVCTAHDHTSPVARYYLEEEAA